MNVLSFDWQGTPVSRWRRLRLRPRKLKPLYADYHAIPGGHRFRWPRYVLAALLRYQRNLSERLRKVFAR